MYVSIYNEIRPQFFVSGLTTKKIQTETNHGRSIKDKKKVYKKIEKYFQVFLVLMIIYLYNFKTVYK